MQHAFHADVFIDIGPVNALTIAKNLKMLPISLKEFTHTVTPA